MREHQQFTIRVLEAAPTGEPALLQVIRKGDLEPKVARVRATRDPHLTFRGLLFKEYGLTNPIKAWFDFESATWSIEMVVNVPA